MAEGFSWDGEEGGGSKSVLGTLGAARAKWKTIFVTAMRNVNPAVTNMMMRDLDEVFSWNPKVISTARTPTEAKLGERGC